MDTVLVVRGGGIVCDGVITRGGKEDATVVIRCCVVCDYVTAGEVKVDAVFIVREDCIVRYCTVLNIIYD